MSTVDLSWQDQAACAAADPELFTATTYRTAQAALAFCAGCPVTRRCLAARGRKGHASPGVWGGCVFTDDGRRDDPPVVEVERLGRCERCGRSCTHRGRDDCKGADSLCQQLARAYQRAHPRTPRRPKVAA